MSGPKVSVYRVAPYIRENVFKQMRLKRKCIVLSQQIIEKLSDLSVFKEQCLTYMHERKKLGDLAENQVQLEQEVQSISLSLNESISLLRQQLHDAGPIEPMPEKFRYSTRIVEKDEEKVRTLQRIMASGKDSVVSFQNRVIDMMNRYRIDQELVKETVSSRISRLGSFDFNSIAVKKDMHDWSKRDAAMKKLGDISADTTLSDELRARAQKASIQLKTLSEEHLADNFIAISVSVICKDAERERGRRAAEIEEFGERIREYHALCEAIKQEPHPISFHDDWRKEVQSAITELEQYSNQQNETEYIGSCLDTVMEEMGYHVIGRRDVQKKSGRSFHSSLYSFSDGRAVNVTQSDDGQITMELGGLDHRDRLPEEKEAAALEEDMYSFCNQFSEIERRLVSMGVLMEKRISMAPPSEEYATIINLDDFILTNSKVETIDTEETKVVSGKKEMYES